MEKNRFFYKSIILFFVLFLSISRSVSAQYAIGDYGSTSSGNWNVASTWSTWNGASWVASGSFPTSANNVFILSGRTVTLQSIGGPWSSLNLTVEAGAKLWTANSGVNIYMYVFGSTLVCDGQIGDGAIFDGISFGIEGANCTISGIGTFDASRLRKNTSINTTTNLNIAININLRWGAIGSTQIYNGANAASIFNVTVDLGYTLTLAGTCSIDGLTGTDVLNLGGTFTINGTLIIPGRLYLTTNNTANSCNWIINGLVLAAELVASNSGTATHSLTINAGGKLNITGTLAWSTLGTTNNIFTFNLNSTVEYSAAGNQLVRVAAEFLPAATVLSRYGHLILSGSGNKSTNQTNLWIKNDLTISGNAVLDPIPVTCAIFVGEDWINYNSTGFSEKNTVVWINGTGPQSITCPGGEVFYALRYANTGLSYLIFMNSVTVNFQLLYSSNGYINLNANTLTVLNPTIAGIQGANFSRYILSEQTNNSAKIIWRMNTGTGTFTFPFGIPPGGATNYIPVFIKKSAATNIGDVTISTYGTGANNLPWPTTPTNVTNLWSDIAIHNVPDNRHWTVDRFWEIESTLPVSVDSLILSYRQIELPDSDAAPLNLKAQYWNDAIGYWNRTQYGDPSSFWVAVPGFNIYNTAWTLTSLTSPLPIELLSFNAEPDENTILIKWITATEINNDYFTLEKSIDGKNFYPFGKVAGAGNSNKTLEYDFEDVRPFSGITYYRLKQTDYDGNYSYSETVPVKFNKRINNYSLYPNPTNGNAYLVGEADMDSEVIIRSAEGKTVEKFILEKSTKIYPLDFSELKSGVYIIEIISKYESQYLRLMKN